ncbi:MAG TPA: hypothetical protein PKY56_13035 [Candidatus Kapabacteria bacterium]|nr:hypothetical protein [Candidatus Kapabacteria bacterium]HPO61744.1 hypothetical protein [Candidatus Kapabacteria bacterium]
MKNLIKLFIVIFLFNNFLFAQEEKSNNVFEISDSKELIKMYRNLTDVKFLFSPIVLILQDTTVSGLFLGLINKEIHILQDQKIVYVNIENVKKIKIQYKDLCHSDFFNAFFMGAYSMLLFYQMDNYGSTYNWSFLKEKHEDSFLIDPRFLSSLASASVCGTISYVANKSNRLLDFEMKEELFSDEDIHYEFSKLLKGETNQKKLHIKFQFGWINPTIKNLSTNYIILQNNTYYFSENSATNFNTFRNLNISYSLLSDLDLGISYYNLTENDNKFSTDSFFVFLRYENSAYMLNASYYPFRKWLPSIIDLNVGAGMGIAKIQFSYPEIYHIISQPNDNKIIHKTNSYNKLCLSTSLDLGINITNNFTLGLSSDYIVIPGDFSLPEANNRKIFPDNINLSNYFIGFYLKYNLIDYF